ncbi:hypothetical protein Hanom_Chr04g00381801 [Helianthus anomalus]
MNIDFLFFICSFLYLSQYIVISPTCSLVVGALSFPTKTQVPFLLVSYWGGYWAMMVTNPPRGFDPEPHTGFHPAITSASHLVWRHYDFRGNAVAKYD